MTALNFSPYSVLMVCTGNICRSPLAEQLMRARLGEAGFHASTKVSSAGLAAVVGSRMDPTAEEISSRLREKASSFLARQISGSMVSESDLVLTMTRAQRDEVVHLYPRALQRTFTLTEFAKILAYESDDSEHLVTVPIGSGPTIGSAKANNDFAAILRLHSGNLSRKRSHARLTASDDIADPFRQPRDVHEAVATQISLAVSLIVHNFVSWATDSQELAK